MTARRRISSLLLALAVSLAVAGCGDADTKQAAHDDAASTPEAASLVPVTLHPPTFDGGTTFTEGFEAAYAIDPEDPDTVTDVTEYGTEPVELELAPGDHELLVLIHACDARCQPWDAVAQQLAQLDRDEQIGRVTRCRATMNIEAADQYAWQPVVDLGPLAELTPDGAPCRIETGRGDSVGSS